MTEPICKSQCYIQKNIADSEVSTDAAEPQGLLKYPQKIVGRAHAAKTVSFAGEGPGGPSFNPPQAPPSPNSKVLRTAQTSPPEMRVCEPNGFLLSSFVNLANDVAALEPRHPGQAKREPGSQKGRRFNLLRSRIRLRLSGTPTSWPGLTRPSRKIQGIPSYNWMAGSSPAMTVELIKFGMMPVPKRERPAKEAKGVILALGTADVPLSKYHKLSCRRRRS